MTGKNQRYSRRRLLEEYFVASNKTDGRKTINVVFFYDGGPYEIEGKIERKRSGEYFVHGNLIPINNIMPRDSIRLSGITKKCMLFVSYTTNERIIREYMNKYTQGTRNYGNKSLHESNQLIKNRHSRIIKAS